MAECPIIQSQRLSFCVDTVETSDTRQHVAQGYDLLVDLLSAEPLIILNAAFCQQHRRRCPPSEELLRECAYVSDPLINHFFFAHWTLTLECKVEEGEPDMLGARLPCEPVFWPSSASKALLLRHTMLRQPGHAVQTQGPSIRADGHCEGCTDLEEDPDM